MIKAFWQLPFPRKRKIILITKVRNILENVEKIVKKVYINFRNLKKIL